MFFCYLNYFLWKKTHFVLNNTTIVTVYNQKNVWVLVFGCSCWWSPQQNICLHLNFSPCIFLTPTTLMLSFPPSRNLLLGLPPWFHNHFPSFERVQTISILVSCIHLQDVWSYVHTTLWNEKSTFWAFAFKILMFTHRYTTFYDCFQAIHTLKVKPGWNFGQSGTWL